MVDTLHGKLTGVLLILFVLFGVSSLVVNLATTRLFLNEVNQTVALPLAERVVAQQTLVPGGRIDESNAKSVFSAVMAVNPLTELYLLDRDGRIRAFSAAPSEVRRDAVSLAPIRAVLSGAKSPVLGDDPRNEHRRKIFSVAALPVRRHGADAHAIDGYLYVIVGGEQFDSVVRMFQSSQALRWGTWIAVATLAFSAFVGTYLFRRLTSPLRELAAAVDRFRSDRVPPSAPILTRGRPTDEIARLASAFERMSAQIAEYLDRVSRSDAQRRELVTNISHDLRTPLAAVQGYLDTLVMKQDTLTGEQQLQYLHQAAGQARRIDRLVMELFELATLESGEIELNEETFSACDLVQDVVQKFQVAAAERAVALDAAFDDNVPLARGDIRLIERVLDNLIDNALRHTPPHGHVRVSCARDDSHLTIRVEDTGAGIDPDDLPRIFDRFYRGRQAPADGNGAGLGLAISKRIVELHRSTLTVSSTPGSGSVFGFTLPT